MSTRPRFLPAGWYPRDAREIRKFVEPWRRPAIHPESQAVLAPHAGWTFSGALAAQAWASLEGSDTLVIVGGHLGPRSPLLYAPEEAFETPLGALHADRDFLAGLLAELPSLGIPAEEDLDADNTVEVQLPFAALFFPAARIVWLRAPASEAAISIGQSLHRVATRLGRKITVVASSDLTHFGPDYGFEPAASRPDPVAWLRDFNDKAFLDAVLAMNPGTALLRAREDRSACSAGAVATALGFAKAAGASRTTLLGYATSYAVRPAPSFVGYAALGFYRPA